ncbi:MAG: hypothetical protein ABIS47_09710 [Acidimicrobiales bacterium]
MSTRKLIAAALLCGVAILIAGTVLLFTVSTGNLKTKADQAPPPPTTTR